MVKKKKSLSKLKEEAWRLFSARLKQRYADDEVLSLGPNASEQDIESRLLETNKQIEKLKTAGFIVLDAQAVVGADDSVFVPVGSKEVSHADTP